MPARNVTKSIALPRRLDQLLARKVASGKYRSESEVIQAGLRLLDSHEREALEIGADIDRGWSDSEDRLVLDGPGVFEDIRAVSRAKRGARRRK